MELKRSHSRRLYEDVADAIQDMIRTGELIPGDQLISERALVEKFGVSRASIRQALSALANRGVLSITPRGGAYVRSGTLADVVSPVANILLKTPGDVLQLVELRRIIEVESARLAATRATAADILQIRDAAQRFQADVAEHRVADTSDTLFHLAICQATGNQFIAEVLRMFGSLLEGGYGVIRRHLIEDSSQYDWSEMHFAILASIEQRDSDRAAKLMADYLEKVEAGVRRVFAQGPQ